MDNFTFQNFLRGPLGYSFGVIKEKGYLFTEESFDELPPEMLQRYNKLSNSNEDKLYVIDYSEEDKTLEVVTELERISLIQASDTIRKIVQEGNQDITDEKEIIEYFASKFNFITDIKPEPAIYKH